jgi:hypothetical protein
VTPNSNSCLDGTSNWNWKGAGRGSVSQGEATARHRSPAADVTARESCPAPLPYCRRSRVRGARRRSPTGQGGATTRRHSRTGQGEAARRRSPTGQGELSGAAPLLPPL